MATKAKNSAAGTAIEETKAERSVAAAAGAKPIGERRWIVTIPYVPPTVINAADEADAWEKFKSRWGIIKSEHVPVIKAEVAA